MANVKIRLILFAALIGLTSIAYAESPGQCVDRVLYAYIDSNQLTFDHPNCHLSDNNVNALKKIVNFVNQHPTIDELWLWGNKISDEGAKIIANAQVKTIEFENNQVGSAGAAALAQNKYIKSLDLMGNRIDDEGAQKLSENTTLESLSLNKNKLSANACKAFSQNKTLQTLDLGHNNLTVDCTRQLSGNTTLKYLALDYNPLGNEGAQALAYAGLQVTGLGLWGTHLSDAGANAIATMTQLTNLGIGCNAITDNGALELAHLSQLNELEISSTKITDVSASALASLPKLKELEIAETDISDTGAQLISDNVTKYNQDGLRLLVGKNPRLTADGIAILRANPRIDLNEDPNPENK